MLYPGVGQLVDGVLRTNCVNHTIRLNEMAVTCSIADNVGTGLSCATFTEATTGQEHQALMSANFDVCDATKSTLNLIINDMIPGADAEDKAMQCSDLGYQKASDTDGTGTKASCESPSCNGCLPYPAAKMADFAPSPPSPEPSYNRSSWKVNVTSHLPTENKAVPNGDATCRRDDVAVSTEEPAAIFYNRTPSLQKITSAMIVCRTLPPRWSILCQVHLHQSPPTIDLHGRST